MQGRLIHKENAELHIKLNRLHQESTELKKKVHASKNILLNREEARRSYDFFSISFYPEFHIWNHIISVLLICQVYGKGVNEHPTDTAIKYSIVNVDDEHVPVNLELSQPHNLESEKSGTPSLG